jgi:hypothetical protein
MFGVYLLGNNIVYTTQAYPYWWKGIAADTSVLCLTGGILGFFVLPQAMKNYVWILVIIGIVCIFYSGRVILRPTTLSQFFFTLFAMGAGYKMLISNRNPFS